MKDIIFEALFFAARKHRHQKRKGRSASPYINHPIAVASLIVDIGGVSEPEIIAAALLHDTLEDTETTPVELEAEFGPVVAGLVRELSDDRTLPREERKRLQVEHAATLSLGARIVKVADKICNLDDLIADPPTGWSCARKRAYFDWARTVVDKIRATNPGLEQAFDARFAMRP